MAIGVVPLHPRHPSRPPVARAAPQGAAAAGHRADRPRGRRRRQGRHQRELAHARRAVASGRRAFAVLPVVAVSALLFTGCSADVLAAARPLADADARPRPSSSRRASRRRRSPRRRPSGSSTRIAATVAEADAALDERPRRDAARGRGAGRARDQLHAARRDRRLHGSGAHPRQAARDRPAAGLRRLAALGDGGRRRRGDEDVEHHGADAAGCVVADTSSSYSGEPRSVDADARPRAGRTSARRQVPPDSPFLVMPPERGRRRVRRHHQQGRGQRVLRPLRGGGRPPAREHRRRPPAAPRRVQHRPAATTGQPDVRVGAGSAGRRSPC